MSRVRAIIQARMLSSRLRGKTLLPVAGTPLLMRVIERVGRMPFIGETVVATTELAADQPIAALVESLGLRCFRGDAHDVLSRFVAATSDLRDNDIVVRFTADNPFYDAARSARAFDEHVRGAWDYTHVDGLSHVVPEFIRVAALRQAAREACEASDREHVTPFLRKPGRTVRVLRLSADFSGLRPEHDRWLTIDEANDLDRIETMIASIVVENESDFLGACYRWLDCHATSAGFSARNSQHISIAGRELGDERPCFVVAEIGQNHNGRMDIAKQLIAMAARSGCDAVKFQKRDIEWDLTRQEYDRPYDNPNSFGTTYGQHREFLELSEAQHVELRAFAQANDLIYFCTACDPPSVDVLERIGNPCYKVASRDVENVPLLRCISQTAKPVILSTGMAGLTEITDALAALAGDPVRVVLTHCVSQYPTDLRHVNLRAMAALRSEFGTLVGLSDHTTGIISSIGAAVLGACYLEKHITLSRAMPGTDHAAALEEEGLRRLVKYVREVEIALGHGEISIPGVVQSARRKLARSLVSRIAISAGTRLTEDMFRLKSPGTGLSWRQRCKIVGRAAKFDIPRDAVLDESQFE